MLVTGACVAFYWIQIQLPFVQGRISSFLQLAFMRREVCLNCGIPAKELKLAALASLNFDAPSKLYLGMRKPTTSLFVHDQGCCSAVCPPPEPSPLHHAMTIHPIRIRTTSLTGSNTVTAICTIPLSASCAPRCRTSENTLSCLPHERRSPETCPPVSNAAGSSQRLAPSIDKTSDVVLAATYGRRDFYTYVTPSRCSLSRILLVLTDRLPRSHTKYPAALTLRSPCLLARHDRPVQVCDLPVYRPVQALPNGTFIFTDTYRETGHNML
ncbi:hypothetical protein K438DRAFT_1993666 [Mycena galopus ATCC 62051]|nr:hypothetical protein K438DRAFT_1993666 [Mycena galopus ATCC 62051]